MHIIADFLCNVTIRHTGLFVHCVEQYVLGFTVKLCVTCSTSYTNNIIITILFRQRKQFVNFKSENLLFIIQCNNVTFAYINRVNLVPLVSETTGHSVQTKRTFYKRISLKIFLDKIDKSCVPDFYMVYKKVI